MILRNQSAEADLVENTPKPLRHGPNATEASAASTVNPSRASQSFSLPFDTEIAPSFPGIFRSHIPAVPAAAKGPPELKESDGQFEVIRELGRGASGVVYLARQVVLNRQVALKVTHNVGSEAQTMANLEHPNVVQVFAESLSKNGNLRLICMQYVAGITLADLIEQLKKREREEINGFTIIEIIANQTNSPIPDEVDVELLKQQSYVETVCQLGLRMALALEHAHRQAVIHRDIKPANILINREGQPLLADFSLSLESLGGERAGSDVFGGTLAYMAPEHLDALSPASGVDHDVVDERSDIYSLGLVLYELLSLEDQPTTDTSQPLAKICKELADGRRALQPELTGDPGRIRLAFDWFLRQCLHSDPSSRFQHAGEVAAALEGCQTLAGIIKKLPAKSRWMSALESSPSLVLSSVGFLPNLVATAIGLAYAFSSPRTLRMSAEAQAVLSYFCIAAVIVATAIGGTIVVLYRRRWVPSNYLAISRSGGIESLRKSLRRFGFVGTLITLLIWVPGLFVVPYLGYYYESGYSPVEFLIVNSIVISVAVSLTYLFGALVAIRAAYPFLWDDVRKLRSTAAEELRGMPGVLRTFHWLAGAVPLAGAICVILAGSDRFQTSGLFSFRMLGIGLIVGGLLLLVAVGAARASIERTIALFTGKND